MTIYFTNPTLAYIVIGLLAVMFISAIILIVVKEKP